MLHLIRRLTVLTLLIAASGISTSGIAIAQTLAGGEVILEGVVYEATACWVCPGQQPVCYTATNQIRSVALSEAIALANNNAPSDPDCEIAISTKKVTTVVKSEESRSLSEPVNWIVEIKCITCSGRTIRIQGEGSTCKEACCLACADKCAISQAVGGFRWCGRCCIKQRPCHCNH